MKMVRSKDVMDAISGALVPIKGQMMPVSEVGFFVYRALSAVREFEVANENATDVTPVASSQPSTKETTRNAVEPEDSTGDFGGQRLCTTCGNVPAYFCSQLCADRWAGK